MSHPYTEDAWKQMPIGAILGQIDEHWTAGRWPQAQLWMNRLQARLNAEKAATPASPANG